MKTLTLILTAACLLVLTRPAPAGWTNDPWNGMVSVCNAPGAQEWENSVRLTDGLTLITWKDEREGSENDRTYYQVLNSSGQILWENNGRTIFSSSPFEILQGIISDGQSGCVILTRIGPIELVGQRLDNLGNRLWGDNGLPIAVWLGTDYVYATDIASDSLGNFFVGWFVGWPDANVYVQKFNVNGQRLWGEYGAPACTNPFTQENIHLVPDDQGGVMAAWADGRPNNQYYHLYFQHLNSAGNPLLMVNGIPLRQTSGGYLGTYGLEGVGDERGGSIWHCTGNTSQPNWYDIVRVNGAGHTLWHFWNQTAFWTHTPNQIVRHSDGTYYAAVVEGRPGNPGDFVYHFDVNGNQLWGALGRKLGSVFTPTSDGIISSADVSHGQISGQQAIRADSMGIIPWVSPYALDSLDLFYVENSASDGSDGIIFPIKAWPSTSAPNILAQRVNSDGTLGTPHKIRPNQDKNIESLPVESPTFILDQTGAVKIEVFDVQGRRVFTKDEGIQQPGLYIIRSEKWDLPSGVYMVKLITREQQQIKKIVITH
jgi:hypothetical protein